jgi:nucleotide-binding universal stress UspA family protein
MAIKNIIVHVDNTAACENRITTAIQLATRHKAELTSIYVTPIYPMPTYYEAQISLEILAEVDKSAKKNARQAQQKYANMASEAGLVAKTITEEGNLISLLSEHARYTDLILLGQDDEDDPLSLGDALADHVVLESGTACLVVPSRPTKKQTGKRILVAWNASREAARAIKDALPVLQRAEHIEILSVDSDDLEVAEKSSPGKDILAYLNQHGITAGDYIERDKDVGPGDAILARVAETDADMVVMGAYGHSRLREIILGGATRKILKQMTVPVFISH